LAVNFIQGDIMARKRKMYSASFRAKVALAASRGDKTVNELASQFQATPQQISNWKSQLLDRVDTIFQDNRVVKKIHHCRMNRSFLNKSVASKWRLTG
jgi:transposase-like protein